MTDEQATARLGRVVGKYRLERVIGSGGMATVYEATHRNGHRVALKMLKPSLAVADEVRGRFLREGYAANKVGHAGAVRILDDDVTSDGLVFLVMELLDGWTLDALTREHGGKLPPRVVLEVASPLLEVLAAAHAAGIVHRDVKPENVFVDRSGAVKVLDFGVARILEPKEAVATVTGRMLGTPAFMPPEQAYGRRDEVDARSDVWSVGATMFTALTGRLVHVGGTAEETLIKAATEAAPKLVEVMPDCPPALAAIVDRALSREKAARWGSAGDMRAAVTDAHRAIFASECATRVSVPSTTPSMDGLAVAPSRRPKRHAAWWATAATVGGVFALVFAKGAARAPTAEDASASSAPATAAAESSAATRAAPLSASPPALTSSAPPAAVSASPAPGNVIARRASAAARAPAAISAPSASTRAASVCGYEFDEEGRKWPKRCP